MTIQFLYPEICLFVFALVLLLGGVVSSIKKFLGLFAILGVVGAFILLPAAAASPTTAFFNLIHGDGISLFFRALILMSTGFIIFLSMGDNQIQEEDKAEYYFFILSLAISMMLAVSTKNLLMIYIALEAVSIISYILVGYFKNNIFSSEAGLKYFLFGALSTGIMLYGISLIYGLFGTLDLSSMTTLLQEGHGYKAAFLLSMVFILVGLSFKCSLAPFHMAAPDAYQGAPTAVTAFLSIGPKAMGFALLLRVFIGSHVSVIMPWSQLAQILAILTMTIGNIIALKQTNVKRMLAYSSIAHAGFMLMALAVVNTVGIKALLIYLFMYVFMNVGAFGCVILTGRDQIEQYAGLSRQYPLAALVMAASLLSLAGLPPLAGFMAKFVVIASVIQAKYYTLAIVAVLNSVVALFYYLRIIKLMYLSKYNFFEPLKSSSALFIVLAITL
ncbi:MAG: NADH-quinone oxidoreductase subunit N, partial [Candidatus Omnitrophota bacterium]